MFNLFNKKPKVRAGKQNNETPASAAKAGGNGNKKPAARFGSIGAAWKKLNSMDRKQAYTWGAVVVVALVALLTLGSAIGSDTQDDFTDFETRGYDLANMPFSSDEAEQYLLASKYPDMKNTKAAGLYTKEEKEARQAEDTEAAAELDTSAASQGSEYVPGRYYGGGAGGSGARTQVGSLNSANLKGASGSGIQGSFGPTGDFSNFRSQDKGRDKFTPQGPGKGNARTALFQAAKGSRAAAGLKNDKLLNAKKAMMGSNVKGSDAFLNDSGAVSLKDARGLELDTNAPVSSADLGGLDDALQDAKDAAEDEAAEEEEQEWWKDLLVDLAKQAVQGLIQIGMNSMQNAIADAQAKRGAEHVVVGQMAEQSAETAAQLVADMDQMKANMGSNGEYNHTITNENGGTTEIRQYQNDKGEYMETRTTTTVGENGQINTTSTTRNYSQELKTVTSQTMVSRTPDAQTLAKYVEWDKKGALPEAISKELQFKPAEDGSTTVTWRGEEAGTLGADGQYTGKEIRLHKGQINSQVRENIRKEHPGQIEAARSNAVATRKPVTTNLQDPSYLSAGTTQNVNGVTYTVVENNGKKEWQQRR